jgi:hypothetical protein
LDSVKDYLPEKGPYVDAWKKLSDSVGRPGGPREMAGSRSSSQDQVPVKDEMQKLLSLVSERESARKAKEAMIAAKTNAQAKVDPAVHYLFRLAKYEEGNADDAFAKNDYSGGKALYRVLERVYTLSLQCADDRTCLETLRAYVAALKKEVDRLPSERIDEWLLRYAQEIENQAQGFLSRQETDNAGGAFLRAGFLYEKIKDAASAPAV